MRDIFKSWGIANGMRIRAQRDSDGDVQETCMSRALKRTSQDRFFAREARIQNSNSQKKLRKSTQRPPLWTLSETVAGRIQVICDQQYRAGTWRHARRIPTHV